MRDNYDLNLLEEYTVNELKSLAKAMEIDTCGSKAELISRIRIAYGKSKTVKVIATYKDLQRQRIQRIGDRFTVTNERAEQLINAGVAEAE